MGAPAEGGWIEAERGQVHQGPVGIQRASRPARRDPIGGGEPPRPARGTEREETGKAQAALPISRRWLRFGEENGRRDPVEGLGLQADADPEPGLGSSPPGGRLGEQRRIGSRSPKAQTGRSLNKAENLD